MKLRVNPNYKPLVQMRWCCAACAVQWVLCRRGFWVDQEIIAKELDTKIPKNLAKLFSTRLKTCKRKKDCGTMCFANKKSTLVNDFLKKYRIPLKHRTFLISEIKNPKEFLIENIKSGNDILLSFNWKGIGKRWNWGHIVLISEFNTKINELTLGDPSQENPKFWKIKLNKITHAMLPKWDKIERGFYIFRQIK